MDFLDYEQPIKPDFDLLDQTNFRNVKTISNKVIWMIKSITSFEDGILFGGLPFYGAEKRQFLVAN